MTTQAQMRATAKYKRTHLKRISFEVQNEYWNDVLSKAVKESGLSLNGFIKEAVKEYIEKHLLDV